MSEIKKYNRGDYYQKLPQALLQTTTLSYEAIGLLCQLESHSENFKIYKTQLYHRSKKNSRHKIDKIWEELEENNYLVSLRKREGKKYVYEYVFSTIPFSEEEKVNICEEYMRKGYELPVKKSNQELVEKFGMLNFNSPNEQSNLEEFGMSYFSSPKKPVKSTFFEVLNINSPKKDSQKNFGMLNFSSPKSTVENQQLINNNKINNNKIYISESHESGGLNSTDTIKLFEQETSGEELTVSRREERLQTELNTAEAFATINAATPLYVLKEITTWTPSVDDTQEMLSALYKAKSKVSQEKNKLILFEEMTEDEQKKLKAFIKQLARIIYAKKVPIQNPQAYMFTSFKQFFDEMTPVYCLEHFELSEEVMELLSTADWINDLE